MSCEDQACTRWLDFCPSWPCCTKGEGARLVPNERGFWCCPSCGGSYGRKTAPVEVPAVEHSSAATFVNGEARYLDDSREKPVHELAIFQDNQGDFYVMVRPVGHKMGPSVRLCASGGADHVRGLREGVMAVYQSIKRAAGAAPDGCEGAGHCHGAMKWCDTCGDVSKVCDDRNCDPHWRVHHPEEAE